jgi:hypothetical protein
VDACNPLLQAHPTWARDEHEGRGISTSLTPVSGHLASPPFALAHALDPSGLGHAAHSLVGLGTPRSRNADRVEEALQDLDWVLAMQEELNHFKRNEVWSLVPHPKQNVVGTK